MEKIGQVQKWFLNWVFLSRGATESAVLKQYLLVELYVQECPVTTVQLYRKKRKQRNRFTCQIPQLDIPDVGRNHILEFSLVPDRKIISVQEIYSDSLFNSIE